MLPDPPERLEGGVPVAAGRAILVLSVGVGQGVIPVRVVRLVFLVKGLEPVLPRVVGHGTPCKGGVHVIIPDVRVGRLDGVKKLLIVVGFMADESRPVLDLDPPRLQKPGVAVVLFVLQAVAAVPVPQDPVIAVQGGIGYHRVPLGTVLPLGCGVALNLPGILSGPALRIRISVPQVVGPGRRGHGTRPVHHVRIDLLDVGGGKHPVFGYFVLLREVHGPAAISGVVLPGKGVVVAVPVGVLILGLHGVAVPVHPDDMAVLVPVQAL